jgi:hypothetical protein
MITYLILILFMVPVAALGWRIIVTKSRSWPLKIGGAGAAMATLVGALTVFDQVQTFNFKDWRDDIGLAASASGTVYLFVWALRHRTNQRHRTVSLIAAVIGLVPLLTAVATATLYGQL